MKDIYQYQDSFSKYKNVESECLIKSEIMNPQITVFIPTYKRTDTLEETLVSVINQETKKDFEIIIVSNDPNTGRGDTFELINKMRHRRISYYVNKDNIGPHGNFNRGVELSNSEYVVMIHDDDILSPFFLDSIFKTIKEFNNPEIIGVGYKCFNSGSVVEFKKPNTLKHKRVTKKSLFFGYSVNIAGLTIKKEFLNVVGGYSQEYQTNADQVVIYQGAIEGSVINIENELAAYRQDRNLSLQPGVMNEIFIETELIRRNIAEKEPFAKKWMFIFDKEYLFSYIKAANSFWNLNLDFRDVFLKFGFSAEKPSNLKLYFMKFVLKVLRRFV